METKQIRLIDYDELDKLVNEYLNINTEDEKFKWDRGEQTYSFAGIHECHNDAYYPLDVYNKFNDPDFECDEPKSRDFLLKIRELGQFNKELFGWQALDEEDILGLMCKDGVLEEGEYMVHVSW